jgi:hypothetical protein
MDNTTLGIYVILAVLLLIILFALLFWSCGYWGMPAQVIITPVNPPPAAKEIDPLPVKPVDEANANVIDDASKPATQDLPKEVASVVEPMTERSEDMMEAVTGESSPSFDALTQATLNYSKDSEMLIKDVASSAWTKTRD